MTRPDSPEPGRDCPLCPRLVEMREANRTAFPSWHNAPVPSWGPRDAPLMVLGMAPGLRGANRTGRPFTGDHAGRLLYATLLKYGLARGVYEERPDDSLILTGCRVTNAVRCVPPANRPLPAEIATCRQFLAGELGGGVAPRVILALGRIAHESVLRALGARPARHPFAHGAVHRLPGGQILVSSFHTSRYNVNTGRLTTSMFEEVVALAARLVAEIAAPVTAPA